MLQALFVYLVQLPILRLFTKTKNIFLKIYSTFYIGQISLTVCNKIKKKNSLKIEIKYFW